MLLYAEMHILVHVFIWFQSSFIHSGHFYSTPSSPLLLRGAPDYSTDTVSCRSAQAAVGKGLAQGPYVAARAGVEPTTLRLKVIASTNAPPRPNQFAQLIYISVHRSVILLLGACGIVVQQPLPALLLTPNVRF